MKRCEIYLQIKSNKLEEVANARARKLKGYNANYTNLTNDELMALLKDHACTCKSDKKECIDKGARKAILAIGKVLNIQGLEKNFE